MSIVAVSTGLFLIVMGVLAYRGLWRGWAFAGPVFSYGIGFGTLYAGSAMVISGGVTLFEDAVPLPAQRVAAVIALTLMGLTFMSLFWLPRFLTPRWFRAERAAQRGHGGSAS